MSGLGRKLARVDMSGRAHSNTDSRQGSNAGLSDETLWNSEGVGDPVAAATARRNAELTRANEALQTTIDALSKADGLDGVVPKVLDIIASTFRTDGCAFYSNDPDGRIHLLYWHIKGRIWTPEELLSQGDERWALVKTLAEGFYVPDDYLGGPVTELVGPIVVDHAAGTTIPEFDAFTVGLDLGLELNIGVSANGVRASTLVIYREWDRPFTEDEIALGDALAKQLGVAYQTHRLAQQAQAAAVSMERERATQLKVDELARAQAFLADSAAKLQSLTDLDDRLLDLVHSASQILGAAGGAFGVVKGQSPVLFITDRYPCEKSPLGFVSQSFSYPFSKPENLRWYAITSENSYWWSDVSDPRFSEGFREYHLAAGRHYFAHFPVRIAGVACGFLGFAFHEDTPPSQHAIDVVQMLADHASTAIQMSWLAEATRKITAEKAEEARTAAVLEERNRIAREMHDGITQVLAAVVLNVGEAILDLPTGSELSQRRLERVEQLARNGLQESRLLLSTLRGEGLGEGFADQLAQKIRDIADEGGLDLHLDLDHIGRHLGPAERFCLTRICQESMTNVVKHANASSVRVTWAESADRWKLTVEDDGIGFDERGQVGHYGITGMRERSADIGAKFDIRTSPGCGTIVQVQGLTTELIQKDCPKIIELSPDSIE